MPDDSPSQKYELLAEHDFHESNTSLPRFQQELQSRRIRTRDVICGLVITLSIALNIFLSVRIGSLDTDTQQAVVRAGRSKFAGLEYKIEVPIYASTEYGPAIGTQSERDALWDSINIDPGVLAIPDSWADEHGIPRSQRFPWDQRQGVYLLGVFHQIHCLKQIHKMVSEYSRGVEITVPYEHVEHCLDSILQEAFCHADDTPWYQLPPEPAAKDYEVFQSRQCRNWDELLEWADEFNACYQYENVTILPGMSQQEQELEHYRFCPPDSPHTEKMERYFKVKEVKGGKAA